VFCPFIIISLTLFKKIIQNIGIEAYYVVRGAVEVCLLLNEHPYELIIKFLRANVNKMRRFSKV